jgi:hypothetical protein
LDGDNGGGGGGLGWTEGNKLWFVVGGLATVVAVFDVVAGNTGRELMDIAADVDSTETDVDETDEIVLGWISATLDTDDVVEVTGFNIKDALVFSNGKLLKAILDPLESSKAKG